MSYKTLTPNQRALLLGYRKDFQGMKVFGVPLENLLKNELIGAIGMVVREKYLNLEEPVAARTKKPESTNQSCPPNERKGKGGL